MFLPLQGLSALLFIAVGVGIAIIFHRVETKPVQSSRARSRQPKQHKVFRDGRVIVRER